MAQVNKELLNKLQFKRHEELTSSMYKRVVISVEHDGIYREYAYIEIEDAEKEETFAKCILTHAIERALNEKAL
jgi:hypothetical protein